MLLKCQGSGKEGIDLKLEMSVEGLSLSVSMQKATMTSFIYS